jgi:uncharacterized protein YcbK (DUF882 family)
MSLSISRGFTILRICILLFLILLSCYILITGNIHGKLKTFFNTACIDYKQNVFSKKLTDRIVDYSNQARLKGIKECKDKHDIQARISEGKLFSIRSSRQYIIENMSYSYPCLTKESKNLLEEIGRRFREKTNEAGLTGARFTVTSMTRTTEKMKNLRKSNQNASVNSPHLNGNAFDISYIRFSCKKLFVTSCDKKFLKESLAQVIWELKTEEKCWATYETSQYCFHVVSR